LRRDENNSKNGDSELFGNILNFSLSGGTFTVRGVLVNIGTVVPSGTCSSVADVKDGTYVEVHGNTTASGVNAVSINCGVEPAPSVGGAPTTVERVGNIKSISSKGVTSGAFVMTTTDFPDGITTTYDSVTLFPKLPITDGTKLKVGTTIEVEGYLTVTASTTAFVATKIKLD
jgi:hypothetical protein